jgi:hypothetical protein
MGVKVTHAKVVFVASSGLTGCGVPDEAIAEL